MWNTPNSEIERELSSGEKLLWNGRPAQGFRLRPPDAFVIPFSLAWCGFAIFWESSVISAKAPIFFKLWGIPFILVGLYFVVGRFFVDVKTRTCTFYGVTNDRIIIVCGLFSRQTKSLQLRTLSDISLVERADGSGTILFGPQYPYARRFPAGWPGASQYTPPAFEMIERAKETYDLIRQAQKEGAGAGV
jgi:Bacterial PH domain